MRGRNLLRQAVWTALQGVYTLDVWDSKAPDDVDGPYQVLESGTSTPEDSHTDRGSEDTLTLHTWYPEGWNDEHGSRQVEEAMEASYELVHHQVLNLAGGGSVEVVVEFEEVLLDESEPGESWHHGVQRLRASTLEAIV